MFREPLADFMLTHGIGIAKLANTAKVPQTTIMRVLSDKPVTSEHASRIHHACIMLTSQDCAPIEIYGGGNI